MTSVNWNKMNKDQLIEYGRENYGVELNPRDLRDALVEQLKGMEPPGDGGAGGDRDVDRKDEPPKTTTPAVDGKVDDADKTDSVASKTLPHVDYLLNKKTKVVFIATDALRAKTGMVPCDREGHAL